MCAIQEYAILLQRGSSYISKKEVDPRDVIIEQNPFRRHISLLYFVSLLALWFHGNNGQTYVVVMVSFFMITLIV